MWFINHFCTQYSHIIMQKNEINCSLLVELFTSFCPGFTGVFSKLSVNQFTRTGSLILPDPDTYFTEDSRLKDGRTPLLSPTELMLTLPVLSTLNAKVVPSERREIVHSL